MKTLLEHLSRLLLIQICLLVPVHSMPEQETPRVKSFSPQNQVKNIRQVQARFSDAMVAFGDPRASDPFLIDCSEQGYGRWVDTSSWVFDFDRDTPAGVQCSFTIRPGLETLEGTEIGGTKTFGFSTGGPAILRSNPWDGSQRVNEDQVFILELDGIVSEESVVQKAHFLIEGVANKIPVEMIGNSDKTQILENDYRYRSEKDLQGRFTVIRAKQILPSGKKINLIWDQGIQSESGVATDQPQVLRFKTRPGFTARMTCRRENSESNCIPITPIHLVFSAPVRLEDARNVRLFGPENQVWEPEVGSAEPEFTQQVFFEGPFPPETEMRLEIPAPLYDDAGRQLLNADRFPLVFSIDDYPPLAKFSASFGILEAANDPVLPVTLRNLEAELPASVLGIEGAPVKASIHRVDPTEASHFLNWLRKIQSRRWPDRGHSVFDYQIQAPQERIVPKPNGEKAFEVVGIPLEKPGFYIVELKSEILGRSLLQKPAPMFVSTAALVTNLAVHLKWGVESSLIWVTQLNDGEPVSGAAVEVVDCQGQVLWKGDTKQDGTALTSELPRPNSLERCEWNRMGSGLFVVARKDSDVSFVHSDWKEGIENWRFRVPREYDFDLVTVHTVLDRPLFRAGESVHMKHLIRQRMTDGFEIPERIEESHKLVLTHQGSWQKYEFSIEWDGSGISESVWNIPKEARLGQYQIGIQRSDGRLWNSGSFRVEEFRIPLMKGTIHSPEEPLINPSRIRIGLTAEYLAGSKASKLPVKIRHQLKPGIGPLFDDLEEFVFIQERVKERITRSNLPNERADQKISTQQVILNQDGWAEVNLEGPGKVDRVMNLFTELEFRDPNGQVQTSASEIPVFPAKRLVGISTKPWTRESKEVELNLIVVDLSGTRLADSEVEVEVFQRKTYSHRKRLVGGFYSFEHFNEIKSLGNFCRGKTNQAGILECRVRPQNSGNLILQATTTDSDGNSAVTSQSIWVRGEDEWWFSADDHDRIDLLADKKRYEPGEVAQIQVKMPFRKATALVTTEREGIGEVLIRHLEGKDPIIELPIDKSYAPNIFVSVLVVRGRIAGTQPTALVDLGKPSYKLGITQIEVGWKGNELKVDVIPEKKIYRVRDSVQVTVEVSNADGSPLQPESEIALAAVDEGLLQLQSNESWKLLEAMMGHRRLAVETATAQMHVVGKRHFGLKALPEGGGGGKQSTRELFDTLLFWNPRVKLDSNGRALVTIPLNDSVTSFRITAIATAGLDRFGTGDSSIRTIQDLVIFSGVAPTVREGDRVFSEFTLLNSSERDMEIQVKADVNEIEGDLKVQNLKLNSGESQSLGWDIEVPTDVDQLTFEIEAVDSNGSSDRIKATQKVSPLVPVRTFQADLEQVEGDLKMPVRLPRDAVLGRGGIQLELRSTLLNTLGGIQEYMSGYPYHCLEQEISKSISLDDKPGWEFQMEVLPAYMDTKGLLRYFPGSYPNSGSSTLTAYVLSIAHERGWEIPSEYREKMLGGLSEFVNGSISQFSVLNVADRTLRKLIAIEALSRYNRAQPIMLSSFELAPNLWPSSSLIDYINILSRLSKGQENLTFPVSSGGKRAGDLLQEASQILESRLNLQGTRLSFSTERIDRLSWLMVSPDMNSVRLILSLLERKTGEDDIPRLMRAALARQNQGRWDLTTANAWGVLAVGKFSQEYEKETVSGVSYADLAQGDSEIDWLKNPNGSTVLFDWPITTENLTIRHQGEGRPWALIRSLAAIPLTEQLESGFSIQRSIIPVEQKQEGKWSIGDIYRVRLEVSAQADQTWVVISDPIPSGGLILGTGLGGDSVLASQLENITNLKPIYEERSFESFRAYYRFVPKGIWSIEYTVRLNASGDFNLPPSRIEAMYAPEIFGEIPVEKMSIQK